MIVNSKIAVLSKLFTGTITKSNFILMIMNHIKSSTALQNEFDRMVKQQCFTIAFHRPGPELIKLFSCSTHLTMIFFLLINNKMPTIVGILTFMRKKNSPLCLSC